MAKDDPARVNRIRGEVQIKTSTRTYVLRPDHDRAVHLDDALPLGILGTLVRAENASAVSMRTIAITIRALADEAPSVEELMRELVGINLYDAALLTTTVLSNIASGSQPSDGAEGNAAAPSSPGIGSTGAGD